MQQTKKGTKTKAAQRQLGDYDDIYIAALGDAVDLTDLEAMAIEKALESHPVTKFVKHLPVEPLSMYPAISEFQNLNDGEIPYLAWGLPMRDNTISKRLGCGIHRSERKELAVTACTREKTDYIKAISRHCWLLGCSNCGNSTAIRTGAQSESRILSLKDIEERLTGHSWPPRHWVISPPQEWALRMMQLPDTYKEMYHAVIDMAARYGLHSGAVVVHPWRLNGNPILGIPATKWEAGPHFHIIGYGKVDTDGFRTEANLLNPGYEDDDNEDNENFKWVIKLIHPDKEIRSVRQTIAYLLTHAGLNSYMRPDPEVNFCDVLDFFTPRVEKDEFYYNVEDPLERPFEDWEQWTKRKLKGRVNILTYYGGIRTRAMRVFDNYKEPVVRKCPVCEAPLGVFSSVHACDSEPVEFIKESKIYVRADDYDFVKDVEQRHHEALFRDGNTLLDFALAVPQLSCPESQGVQPHEPKYTRDFLKDLRSHTIVYLPHPCGYGFKPTRVTLEEKLRMQAEGMI